MCFSVGGHDSLTMHMIKTNKWQTQILTVWKTVKKKNK